MPKAPDIYQRNNRAFERRQVPAQIEPSLPRYRAAIRMREREIARLTAFRNLAYDPRDGTAISEQDRRHAREDIEFIRGEIEQIHERIRRWFPNEHA